MPSAGADKVYRRNRVGRIAWPAVCQGVVLDQSVVGPVAVLAVDLDLSVEVFDPIVPYDSAVGLADHVESVLATAVLLAMASNDKVLEYPVGCRDVKAFSDRELQGDTPWRARPDDDGLPRLTWGLHADLVFDRVGSGGDFDCLAGSDGSNGLQYLGFVGRLLVRKQAELGCDTSSHRKGEAFSAVLLWWQRLSLLALAQSWQDTFNWMFHLLAPSVQQRQGKELKLRMTDQPVLGIADDFAWRTVEALVGRPSSSNAEGRDDGHPQAYPSQGATGGLGVEASGRRAGLSGEHGEAIAMVVCLEIRNL